MKSDFSSQSGVTSNPNESLNRKRTTEDVNNEMKMTNS